eukprot:m.675498 g.675498  ORF g.675498 m.675498 type:complete len:71 (-) comp58554_c0_seq4:372-584(-)
MVREPRIKCTLHPENSPGAKVITVDALRKYASDYSEELFEDGGVDIQKQPKDLLLDLVATHVSSSALFLD